MQLFEVRLALVISVMHLLDEALTLGTLSTPFALLFKAVVRKRHFDGYSFSPLRVSVIEILIVQNYNSSLLIQGINV